jgi:aspartate kinase
MIVMKFGGSSIASPEKVERCVDLVAAELDRAPIVVVSAHGRTTNQLMTAAELALTGTLGVDPVVAYHRDLTAALGLSDGLITPLLDEMQAFLRGVTLIRELTPRTLDHILSFGERLSTRVVAAAMKRRGIEAAAVNAYDVGMRTDSAHGSAAPLPETYTELAAGLHSVAGLPVVTGFLGKDAKGNITTLGRSGSDFTASIVGAALAAEEVQIWTDVSGIMTCDPTVDPNAQSLRRLSFDEASELAYYGAQVLHPSTLVPAIHKGIPVRVLNTMRPEDEGTQIMDQPVASHRFAKSIVYKEDVNLITIASPRLMSAVQILSRAFEYLERFGIGVHMATTSEATVSMVTDRDYSGEPLERALKALSELGEAAVEHGKAIVCVVGEELKGRVDVLGRVFGSLTQTGIKAKMVSQSASEINVAFLVDNDEIETAVRALHALIV